MLLRENDRLRKIVGSLSDFIGEGSGGAAHRIGLTEEGVQAIAKEGFLDLLVREASNLDAVAQEAQTRGSAEAAHHATVTSAGMSEVSYPRETMLIGIIQSEGQRQEHSNGQPQVTMPVDDSLDTIDPSLASLAAPGPLMPDLSLDTLLASDSLSPTLQDLLKQFTQPELQT